jgi:hypothetical protein
LGEKKVNELSDNQIITIFAEIHAGRGNHGGFLRAFAAALLRADPLNFGIMREAALKLISKYDLVKYTEAESV